MSSTDVAQVLVVGGGSIGERHVRCFLATSRARVSLCDTREEIRQRLAREYPLEAVYDELELALAECYDAAVVATPAHRHVALARRLLEAGCHVLIEKPLSTSLEGVAELERAAEQAGKAAGVAYVYRHDVGLAAMRDWLARGEAGTVLEVVHVGGQHFPTFRPAYREIYYRSHATGGGAVQDALTHTLNAVEWLVGPITAVTADTARLLLDGVEVEDTVHALARHGAVLASYALNQHQAPNESALSVHGTLGSARWEPHRRRWLSMTRDESAWQVHAYEQPERDTLFVAQAEAFLDAAAGRTAIRCSLSEARQTLAASLAMLESARRRAWVEVRHGGLDTPPA